MKSHLIVTATVAALIGLSTGCASESEPSSTPAPTVTSTPPATPTPEVTAPETRFDLECDSIATTAAVMAFTNGPIAQQDLLQNYVEQSPELPRPVYIEAMGGLVCDWSNAMVTLSSRGASGPGAGATVLILPEADTQFATYVDVYGPSSGLRCSASSTSCFLETLINGYWLSVRLDDVAFDEPDSDAPPSAVTEFANSIVALVSALGTPAPRWAPPSTTVALGPECNSLVSPSEAQIALGLSSEPSSRGPHGGWSIWAGATLESGGGRCSWSEGDEETSYGQLAWLPAGAWAAERLLPVTTYPSAASAAIVPNLAVTDRAFNRCTDDESYCVVDLIIAGNWVQATGWADDVSSLSAHDRAIALAGAVAAHVYD